MTERRRRRPRKVTVRKIQDTGPATPEQILQELQSYYRARQIEWELMLASERIDWLFLLALHLQMVEIEHLEDALEEFT